MAALLILIFVTQGSQAQPAGASNSPAPTGSTPYTIVESGPHHRVWQRVTTQTDTSGGVSYKTNAYTELATGLNQFIDGKWIPSSQTIQITADGAAATNGVHHAFFSGNINTTGATHLVLPDGQHMRSHIMGLAYADSASGKSVFFAALQDSTGLLLPTLNQVLYTNAFTDVNADVRYTYTKIGLEQDVILREQPPSPALYGLDPNTTALQVWTEFTEAPVPKILTQTNHVPAWDQQISFGSMRLATGKALSLEPATNAAPALNPPSPPRKTPRIPVAKAWEQIGGRTFLLEQIPYNAVTPQVQTLPPRKTASLPAASPGTALHRVSSQPLLLPSPGTGKSSASFQLARVDPANEAGFVLDYVEINSGDSSDINLESGITYYISGEIDSGGNFNCQSNAILKFGPSGQIDIDDNSGDGTGNFNCLTTAWQPGIFTSMNDDSQGETIDGSSGSPCYMDVWCCLNLNADNVSLHDLSFSYNYGWAIGQNPAPASVNLQNCQFFNLDTAISGCNASVFNVLISRTADSGVDGAIMLSGTSLTGGNITADGGGWFASYNYYIGGWTNNLTEVLTNCLVTGLGPLDEEQVNSVTTYNTVCLPSPNVPVYDSGPLGNFYLVSGSPCIDAGNAPASTLGLYWYTTQVSQNPEGTSTVDLGYHSLALDSSGNPLSTFGDGVPNYLDDSNGNGIPDALEIACGFNPTVPNNLGAASTPGYSVFLAEPKTAAIVP
jgi:hypothetical protein